VICAACQAANEDGRKFCGECGASLSAACPTCGTPNAPDVKFCGECGTKLGGAAAVAPVAAATHEPAAAERRLVSVLFVDLVGFTAASEGRDSEDTRDLLTRYFDVARTVIERYGGTVEKFIGDAVMAVWGAPVAQEDDAERAVRAALDLAAAVPEINPLLRARAGVLTGEAAVTLGATNQGMVAGDLVNTASRIQSAAEPGTVLAGDATKRATEATVAYEDAGLHEMKGKTEPMQLWRAMRVVAGRGGSMRSAGLEAPFVGRNRELQLVKDLFHATEEERRAQLVLVSGIAGIGKSRLAWEFEKYIDGLAVATFWHRGRCLSYGEGVAYWALAEMVRMRCGILEDEHAVSAGEKLTSTLEEHVPDAEERRWVRPRIAHLLGLEDGIPGDEENLFSAWRILFERLAEQGPTVLLFEDVQWADAGLLDFIEYLLDWSRSQPLYVFALARPEFAEKRSTWAGKRGYTQLYLEPLPASAMNELLTGLVPGLPEDLRGRVLERAEGVPLYAVETVRMLLDRGLLTRDGDVYRPTGPIEQLEMPETLQALVAARLDGLTADERHLVQDGAVLGKTFTKQGLTALTGMDAVALEPILASLLRKEVLSVQADPLSPERGQYAFLQDIVKKVAYETISRKERKAKHLATAEYLLSLPGSDEDEIVEVVAQHLIDALESAPDADDAGEIRDRAREMLVRAGERAASLAATAEAQRAYERAADLTDDALVQAELYERAGMVSWLGGRGEDSKVCLERSIELYEASSETHAAARVAARLAEVMWNLGRLEDGLERMNTAFELLSQDEPDADLAWLAAQLGRFLFFGGQAALAVQRIEAALAMAESLLLPEVLAQALTTKAIIMMGLGRPQESLALLQFALRTATEHDKPSAALRASYNLSDTLAQFDRYEEACVIIRDGLAQSRRVGNRAWELSFLGQLYPFYAAGAWDEALSMLAELPIDEWEQSRQAFVTGPMVQAGVGASRGTLHEARLNIDRFRAMDMSGDVYEKAARSCAQAFVLLADGDLPEALAAAEGASSVTTDFGYGSEVVKESFVIGGEAALGIGDSDKLEELLVAVEALPPGRSTRFLRAHTARFRARLAGGDDPASAERGFGTAAAVFREIGMPFCLAVVQLEHAELLAASDRAEECGPLLAEARETFEHLRATPWLERLDALGVGAATAA
jgi:class 3 adenylate cyclase/tetratricopeptide (TPR) repeat protein